MDSEILFVFTWTDPSLPDKHSAQWSSHLGFLFSRSGHHPLPITPIKGYKNRTKIPAKGYLWHSDENKARDKIQISFGKKKGPILQNIKSNVLELERLVITNTQYYQSGKVPFICTWIILGKNLLRDTDIPFKSLLHSQNSIYMNVGWALLRSKGVYNLLKLMKHLHVLSASACHLTFGQCTFIMSGTSAPLIINVIAGSLRLPKKQYKWYWNFVVN